MDEPLLHLLVLAVGSSRLFHRLRLPAAGWLASTPTAPATAAQTNVLETGKGPALVIFLMRMPRAARCC